MASLKDKVVIITGASFGIGATTAVYIAEKGAKIVLAARNEENLKKVASECQGKGLQQDHVLVVPCDVCQEAQLENLVKKTLETYGQIDVLVNNAGIGAYYPILDTKLEVFDEIMKTNVRAPFYLSQLCLPHLTKTKGSIVNVSSISGQRAFAGSISYGMSKAALDHMMKTIAVGSSMLKRIEDFAEFKRQRKDVDFASKGVRCNSVNPGVIVTDFQKKAGMSDEAYEKNLARQHETQPLCGPIDPIDVAKAIAFFASDDARCITGETLFIDGGRHVKAPV